MEQTSPQKLMYFLGIGFPWVCKNFKTWAIKKKRFITEKTQWDVDSFTNNIFNAEGLGVSRFTKQTNSCFGLNENELLNRI